MRIGSSIGLIALGLVLALAVDINVKGIDLQEIGWILAVVGVLGLIISLVLMRRTRPVVGLEAAPPVVGDGAYPPQNNPDARYQDPNARY